MGSVATHVSSFAFDPFWNYHPFIFRPCCDVTLPRDESNKLLFTVVVMCVLVTVIHISTYLPPPTSINYGYSGVEKWWDRDRTVKLILDAINHPNENNHAGSFADELHYLAAPWREFSV